MNYVEVVINSFYDLMISAVPVILGLVVLSVVFRYIARVFR